VLDKHKLPIFIQELLTNLSQRFGNIKKGGKKDKIAWNEEAERYILQEVLKEGC